MLDQALVDLQTIGAWVDAAKVNSLTRVNEETDINKSRPVSKEG